MPPRKETRTRKKALEITPPERASVGKWPGWPRRRLTIFSFLRGRSSRRRVRRRRRRRRRVLPPANLERKRACVFANSLCGGSSSSVVERPTFSGSTGIPRFVSATSGRFNFSNQASQFENSNTHCCRVNKARFFLLRALLWAHNSVAFQMSTVMHSYKKVQN